MVNGAGTMVNFIKTNLAWNKVQFRKMNMDRLLNKPYVNEVNWQGKTYIENPAGPQNWICVCYLMRFRSFQKCIVGLCRSTGWKVTCCQSWRFQKNFARGQSRTLVARGQLISRIFFKPPILTACNFAASWPTEIHSAFFERSKFP